MTFERELKETLMRHSTDVRPRDDAWTGVAQQVRRTHKRRIAGISAAVVLAAIGAGLIAPRLVSDVNPRPGGFATNAPRTVETETSDPTPASSPSTPSSPVAGGAGFGEIYRDEMTNVMLRYPDGWRMGRFEGHVSFRPTALPSLEEGGPTVAVELWLDPGDWRDGRYAEGARGERSSIASREALRYDHSSDGTHRVLYVADWSGLPCGTVAPTCPYSPSDPVRLIVQVLGDAKLWSRYGPSAEQTVSSIAVAMHGYPPAHHAVTTPAGRVHESVAYDGFTTIVVAFLEARMEGVNAHTLLAGAAKRMYDSSSNKEELLYTGPRTGERMVGYRVQARRAAEGNQVEFDVSIDWGAEETADERITIGEANPGDSGSMKVLKWRR